MDPQRLLEYASAIGHDLRDNILPFWMNHTVDPLRDSFIGSLTNDLIADREADRGALLSARILWTYSAAYRQYRKTEYIAMADRAYADLLERYYDRRDGGFFWSVDASGRVRQDRKQVYGQAFAIYALAEYHRATGQGAPLDLAIAVFRLLELHARESQHGGYLEAFSRQWEPIADMRLSSVDLNEPKSQNTHLHVLEAYTNLLRVWPDASLRRALSDLISCMLDRVMNDNTGHLGLFFANDWSPRSDRISYGHDIEAAWLFCEAAAVLDDPGLTHRVHALAIKIADVTLAEGVDVDGGLFNEGGPDGVINTNKEWWPQAEAVVGFLNAHQLSRDERHLEAALRTWDFIDQKLIDRQSGEWLRGVTREGAALASELKVSFWKCPYHNGRACLEAAARLRAIAANRRDHALD